MMMVAIIAIIHIVHALRKENTQYMGGKLGIIIAVTVKYGLL